MIVSSLFLLIYNIRQIRNAFQTAIALAEHEANLQNKKFELSERHFEDVAKASEEFDDYLKATHGGRTESDRAKHNSLRDDEYNKAVKYGRPINQKISASQQAEKRRKKKRDVESQSNASSNSGDSDSSTEESSHDLPPKKKNPGK